MTPFQCQVLADVMTAIFEADSENIGKETAVIIAKNKELLGPDTSDGFWFRDEWYSCNMRGRTTQSLHPDLYPEMIVLETRWKRMKDDYKIITQVLCRLIQHCHTWQDMRDELPEVLVSLVPPTWGACPRTREPAQSLQSDPRAFRQYEKVLDKIHSYVAMRYIL